MVRAARRLSIAASVLALTTFAGGTASAIIGGSPSPAAQDFTVMLVFSDPATNQRSICTAALVAPRLVLTARHCVAPTDLDVQCSVDGTPIAGGGVRANHDARKLYVLTGSTRPNLDPATWKPAGRGAEVLDDGSSNLCNHDLALVLLEAPIEGVPIAALRLDGDAEPGELLTTVGWGVTNAENEPLLRQQRADVKVTRVGPDSTSPVLTPNEVSFDESICLGDSGGPVLSLSTGAIVGVVSRGGNGTTSPDLASECTNATNVAVKLSPFSSLVSRAFTAASSTPRLEQRPPSDDSSCALTPRRASFSWSAVTAFALSLAALRRRRAHPSRP